MQVTISFDPRHELLDAQRFVDALRAEGQEVRTVGKSPALGAPYGEPAKGLPAFDSVPAQSNAQQPAKAHEAADRLAKQHPGPAAPTPQQEAAAVIAKAATPAPAPVTVVEITRPVIAKAIVELGNSKPQPHGRTLAVALLEKFKATNLDTLKAEHWPAAIEIAKAATVAPTLEAAQEIIFKAAA